MSSNRFGGAIMTIIIVTNCSLSTFFPIWKDRLNQAPLFVGEVHRIFE